MSGKILTGKISYFESPLASYTEEEIEALKATYGTLNLDIREDTTKVSAVGEFEPDDALSPSITVGVVDA